VKLEGILPIPSSSWSIRRGRKKNHVVRIGPRGGLTRVTPKARRVVDRPAKTPRPRKPSAPLRADWTKVCASMSRSDLAVIDAAVDRHKAAGIRGISRSKVLREAALAWLGPK
jgi:hypothetical protein